MAQRLRRDLIGHFIRREQRTEQPCTHACCRGYRVHPANYPVILPDRTLHRASDTDLETHYRRVSDQETPQARRAEAQILHEMERRDRADARRRESRAARAARQQQRRESVASVQAARRMERESEEQRIYLEADAYTRGNWTNAKGTARGISEREILTGREDVYLRYASDDAKEYFATHSRPTAAYFRGQDTSVPYYDRGTRRRGRRRVAYR